MAVNPSSVNSSSTSSNANTFWNCLTSEFFGSVRVSTNAAWSIVEQVHLALTARSQLPNQSGDFYRRTLRQESLLRPAMRELTDVEFQKLRL